MFGPPGTGKALVMRALVKEAECRMLVVFLLDVMDTVSFYLIYPATASLTHLISFVRR